MTKLACGMVLDKLSASDGWSLLVISVYVSMLEPLLLVLCAMMESTYQKFNINNVRVVNFQNSNSKIKL